jgi:hypothetical protein
MDDNCKAVLDVEEYSPKNGGNVIGSINNEYNGMFGAVAMS